MPSELLLVKLGGSLITDKRQPDTARGEVIRRLARELAEAREGSERGLLLGHGSGSFGHVAAERFGLRGGALSASQLPGVVETRARAAELHHLVLAGLRAAGCRPLSFAPSSFVVASAGRPVEVFDEPVARALELGLLPVVYGDVVADREWGASICSTETVLLAMADRLRRRGFEVRTALWLGETDGLYARDGQTIARLEPRALDGLLTEVDGASGVDVTGGIRHRLETVRSLALLGIESHLLNGLVPGALGGAVGGRPEGGTRILASAAEA